MWACSQCLRKIFLGLRGAADLRLRFPRCRACTWGAAGGAGGGVGGRGAGIGGPGLASEVGVLRFRTFWAPLGGFLVGSWCTPNADVAVNRGFPRVRRRSTPSSDGTRPIWVPSLSEVGAHQLRTGGQTGQSEQGNPGREAWAGHAAGQFAQDKGAAPQGAAPW
jgi:hypothetical protein